MENVSVISGLNQSVSPAAKSTSPPLGIAKLGRSDSRGVQAVSASDKGGKVSTFADASKNKDSLAVVNAVIEDLNKKLEVAQNSLRFQIDDATKEIKVQVVDKDTGKVVRTIPPEPSLSLFASGEFSSLLSVQG